MTLIKRRDLSFFGRSLCACLLSSSGAVSCQPRLESPLEVTDESRALTAESSATGRSGVAQEEIESREVFIYVASSLAEVMNEVARRYREVRPKDTVHLIITGSHQARLQLERGSPHGIFISATPHHVDLLAEQGIVEDRRVIAYNTLALVARADLNISDIHQLSESLRWGVGAPQVPIGELSWSLLGQLNVEGKTLDSVARAGLVTQALSARELRGRAMRGEIDVAILYQSDAERLVGWRHIPLPSEITRRHRATYTLALTRDHHKPPSAIMMAWWRLIISSQTQETFKRFHFLLER